MRICLIPDEYTNDPATAFELGRRWGVDHYEIRYAYRWRVPVGPAWAADRVAAAVSSYGVTVNGIAPGLFKPTMQTDGSKVPISTETPGEVRRHLDELLGAFFAFAERLGATNITVFALPRGDAPLGAEMPQVVIDSLGEAASKAAAAGVQLLLENGTGSWAASAAETGAILRAVNSPALRCTWDPANVVHAASGEDPVTDGYPLVKDFVANVHVKDLEMVEGKGQWCVLGDGLVDWPAQLAVLAADGYTGPLTLEPHLQYRAGMSTNLVEKVETCLARLRKMLP